MGARGPLALCNSGFLPKLIMFLLICFISEATRGARKPSVSLSQLFYSCLCHKCTQQWMEKKMYQACPKARMCQWSKGAHCISWEWAGANPRGDALGLLGQKGGQPGSPAWFLHLLSALLCAQCPPLCSACRSALRSAGTGPWRSAGCLWSHPAKGKPAKLTR